MELGRDNRLAIEPKDSKGRLYHVKLGKRDVGRVALLPGDPDRVPRITKYFKNAKLISSNREYTTYGGYIDEQFVISISTGIGGPATAITVEELARLGVKLMIRVGTTSAINPGSKIGSLIIAEAAVRLDGTTGQYVVEGYPAAATPEVVIALREAAESMRKEFFPASQPQPTPSILDKEGRVMADIFQDKRGE